MAELTQTQVLNPILDIVQEELRTFEKARSVTVCASIPETPEIPKRDPAKWVQIPDVICVFVDMKGSTQLSAGTDPETTAGIYQLFTGTAVRIFHEFEAPYIDVRGDGVFALFNKGQEYRALAAAVSFKTFAGEVFAPTVQKKTDIVTGAHIGIDQRTVLVRRVGLKQYRNRTDRVNEVWAGKPVNMASKLAATGEIGQLLVSDRYFEKITDEHSRLSCGCLDGNPGGEKKDLWEAIDVSDDDKFDFDMAYGLASRWCPTHGKEFCEAILRLDQQENRRRTLSIKR